MRRPGTRTARSLEMPRLIDGIRAAGRLRAPFFVTRDCRQSWLDFTNGLYKRTGD